MQSSSFHSPKLPANGNTDKAEVEAFYQKVESIRARIGRFKKYIKQDNPLYSEGRKFQMMRWLQDAEKFIKKVDDRNEAFIYNLARIQVLNRDYPDS